MFITCYDREEERELEEVEEERELEEVEEVKDSEELLSSELLETCAFFV